MGKLSEVEEARALMAEAAEWSVVKWLREKKRVRKTSDRANAALDELARQTRELWSAELKSAYAKATGRAGGGDGITALGRELRRADEEAQRARMEAENVFDDAEKQLSTRLAREGCRKAIHSWDLHERAISKAQAAAALHRSKT